MKPGIRRYFEQRKRALKTAAVLLVLGLSYALFTRLTGLYIPCVFHLVTGWACPGCGISHFFQDLLRLDFAGAVQQNLAVAVLLPIWALAELAWFFLRIRWLRPNGPVMTALTWVSLVLLLVFGVLRNLPGFACLLPLYMR